MVQRCWLWQCEPFFFLPIFDNSLVNFSKNAKNKKNTRPFPVEREKEIWASVQRENTEKLGREVLLKMVLGYVKKPPRCCIEAAFYILSSLLVQ